MVVLRDIKHWRIIVPIKSEHWNGADHYSPVGADEMLFWWQVYYFVSCTNDSRPTVFRITDSLQTYILFFLFIILTKQMLLYACLRLDILYLNAIPDNSTHIPVALIVRTIETVQVS